MSTIRTVWAWLRPRLLESWRTTLAGVALLALLGLFWLSETALRDLVGKVALIGDLAAAATTAVGTIAALAGALGLALWHKEDR